MKEEILDSIKDDFLSLFKQNLSKYITRYPIDQEYFDSNTGTMEWGDAYRETCKTLERTDLLDFLRSLAWDELDDFAYDLGQVMVEKGYVDK